MTALQKTCSLCNRLAETRCWRCQEPLCARHEVPAQGYGCGACHEALQARVRGRLASRVTVAASAALAGMVAGALLVMLAAWGLGLSAEVTILMMLVMEIGCGAFSAHAADRHMQRWLQKQAQNEMGRLPEARLLPSGRE